MFDMSRIYTLLKASGMVMAAASAGGLLDSRGFDWPTVLTVGTLVFIGGRRFQQIEDRLSTIEKSLGRLPCIGTENVIVKHKTCDE